MGIMDAFPFSLGSFAFIDDLDDCSSGTDTYVERRRTTTSASQAKSKSKSKSRQSVATSTRAHVHETTSKHAAATTVVTVKGTETARSTTVANVNINDNDTRPHDTTTNVSTRRSVANETTARRSTVTAPAAPGREPSRRSRHEKHVEEGERKKQTSKGEEEGKKEGKDESLVELKISSKDTTRSISLVQAKPRDPSRVPPLSEPGTKADIATGELRRENRALHRRTERLEKDLTAYRRHAEHYRERRRDAERERLKAEEHARELETVVTNMRESYELELDDLRTQMAEYAAKASAAASAEQVYAREGTEEEREGTVRELEPSVRAPSRREMRSRAPTVQETPSVHDLSVQTDPMLTQVPLRPATPYPGSLPPTTEVSRATSTLLAQLEQRDAEIRALRLFHEEASEIPLEALTSSVRSLNTELRALAAAVADGVPLGRTWEVAQAWALEAAEPALARCLRLLAGVTGADFAKDPTLVQLSLQAWLVSCLQRVFERFLFGLEDMEDEMLRRLFKRVQGRESLPVAARWRALTRRHARTLATPPVTSAAASAAFSAAQDHSVHLLEMDILVGAEALLRFAGAHSPPGVLLAELSSVHGRRIAHVVRRVARLARDLAERAQAGCEVFTVAVGNEQGHGEGGDGKHIEGDGLFLCGCMENIDQECRRWVGRTPHRDRTTGTRTRTHTRAGTVRSKSKTRSRGRTATTRTWADTNIREWDRDDSEEYSEEDSDEYEEEDREEGGEQDEFADGVHAHGDEAGHAAVVCSLGFGLRRVLRRPRRKNGHTGGAAAGGGVDSDQRHLHPRRSEEELQRERRRGVQAEAKTLHIPASDAKSTSTKLSAASTTTRRSHSASSVATERQRRNRNSRREAEDGVEGDAGREVEVLVKTDVLMCSTVDLLQRRFVR